MNTADIIARVRACRESDLRDINAATGVPMARLQKLRYGITKTPLATTADALRAYFKKQDSKGAGGSSGG